MAAPATFSNVVMFVAIALAAFLQQIHGDKTIVIGEYKELQCCDVQSNCTCYTNSFDDALDRYMTNGSTINVTINVTLSSIKRLDNLQFIRITGHNSSIIVNCHSGGLKILSCHNCMIEGITWAGCGPAILFYKSSNITIQNCSFQHSINQAVVLSKVSGDVNINHCKFVNNTRLNRGHGVAIYYSSSSTELKFTISHCKFNNNTVKARRIKIGSIIYIGRSSLHNIVLINESSFHYNKGKCIYVLQQNLLIEGTVLLQGNVGSAIYAIDHSNVTFGKNSTVTFVSNKAGGGNGGAIHLNNGSNLIFEQTSVVLFGCNKAKYGAAIHLNDKSSVLFDKSSNVNFINNSGLAAGTIHCNHSTIIFKEASNVSFVNNTARRGGAILSNTGSSIVFEGDAKFVNNTVTENGGALLIHFESTLFFKGNSTVTFISNLADHDGAAIYSNEKCNITFTDYCTVILIRNTAYSGGALNSRDHGSLVFEGNSRVRFDTNKATDGGSVNLHAFSTVLFKGNSNVTFINNTAGSNGGAIFAYDNSDIITMESSTVSFIHNVAKSGGAVYATISDVKFSGTSEVALINNEAVHEGGALYLSDKSNIAFHKNVTIRVTDNGASYGGGMFGNLSGSTFTFNAAKFHHYNNNAKIAGSLLYIYIPLSCNRSCLEERVVGGFNTGRLITTSPKKIVLKEPAVPICNDSKTNPEDCNSYYVNNVMLGQEISIKSYLVDFFDNPTDESAQILVSSESKDFTSTSKYALVSYGLDLKLGVIGNNTEPMNYSMTLSTFKLHVEERTPIYVNIMMEVSPCRPGFQYNQTSQQCECFDDDRKIVICYGSTSMIQRGYWFGEVDRKPTDGLCPINYCNFSSCKADFQYCNLSPERINQCKPHRTGTACGNCDKGYTLPFYSPECINIDKCTVLHRVLVIVLTVVYWISLVVAVFIIMYYKVSIGYLYAITYYYSIVDVLLSEYMYISNGPYIAINIMYSIVKLTPQFLGKLCLASGLSGIDQQFIHYIHPLAILLIVTLIVVLARFSHRLSAFISRGIIRVICFLLLLAYTSVANTSLLLIKYLTFYNVDKVYTYLSPDVEYFHGRHLVYGTIALLCIIFIVIGVPLVLIVEPFLNHMINFTKIKPLLDQFQGCYKDKHRCFAAYYMICRIAIFSIAIIFSSDDFTSRYSLVITCAAIVLIHVTVRPYASKILNAFDGLLLVLLVLVSILLLVKAIDSNSIVQITCVLLLLPLMIFSALYLFMHKDAIKKFFIHHIRCHNRREGVDKNLDLPTVNGTNGIDLNIDDTMRKNATICDV